MVEIQISVLLFSRPSKGAAACFCGSPSACRKRHIVLSKCTRTISIGMRSGRAGPSFSVRPEKEAKGAVCTALRQRKDSATNQPVRRDAQKLAASRRSNNLCARFFTARDAVKKSPREPRSEQSAVLPRPSVSAQRRIKMPVPKTIINHAFLCTLLADFIDKLGGLLHAFAAAPAVFLLESHLYRTE